MILPHTYLATLMVIFLSTICWGSWANTQKMTGKWLCEAMKVGRITFGISVLVAAICIVGVVVAVVMTGSDGSLADGLALLAVATLVVAWRSCR